MEKEGMGITDMILEPRYARNNSFLFTEKRHRNTQHHTSSFLDHTRIDTTGRTRHPRTNNGTDTHILVVHTL